MKKIAGVSLIELLTGLLIVGVVFSGLFTVVMRLFSAQEFNSKMPTVQQQAQQMALTVAGAIRRATLCTASDSGCTVNAAFEGNSATGVTVYKRNSDNTLTEITYAVNSGDFQKTIGGGSPATIYSGTTMNLTYYTSDRYHIAVNGALTAYTPDSSTARYLVAVKIDTSVTSGGYAATYSTLVRMRSGPIKLYPSD